MDTSGVGGGGRRLRLSTRRVQFMMSAGGVFGASSRGRVVRRMLDYGDIVNTARSLIASDVAWYTQNTGALGVIYTALRHRTFRPVLTLRFAQHVREGSPASRMLLRVPVGVLHRWACNQAGVDLSIETVVGPGLKLTHGWGAVISPRATLGSRVIVMHGVTVGGVGEQYFPVIEDDVFLGPGCAVLGGVTIGEGAVVGAGCVVTCSVAPGARVAAPEPRSRVPRNTETHGTRGQRASTRLYGD